MALFPITDPSRMADIRMRRRRALVLLLAIVLVPVYVLSDDDDEGRHHAVTVGDPNGMHFNIDGIRIDGSLPEIAASLAGVLGGADAGRTMAGSERPRSPPRGVAMQEVQASALSLDLHCGHALTIMPRQGGDGTVRIYSGQSHGPMTGAPGSTLSIDVCTAGGDVFIEAPPGMPMQIAASGEGDISIGRFTGDLTVTATGGGKISIAGAHNLDLSRSASGDASIGVVTGQARITKEGSGDLAIGDARGPLQIESSGSGDTSIGVAGGQTVVNSRGSADIKLGALNAGARFEIQGSGDLSIGVVRADALGVTMNGSGSLRIAAGRIGMLDVDLRESVDGEVDAQIDSLRQQVGSDASLKFGRADSQASAVPLPPLPPLPPLAPLPPSSPLPSSPG